MPRRTKPLKRQTQPDPQYGSVVLSKIINKVMLDGKKAKAEGIIYDALKIVEESSLAGCKCFTIKMNEHGRSLDYTCNNNIFALMFTEQIGIRIGNPEQVS